LLFFSILFCLLKLTSFNDDDDDDDDDPMLQVPGGAGCGVWVYDDTAMDQNTRGLG
jgi:hypothetical protein